MADDVALPRPRRAGLAETLAARLPHRLAHVIDVAAATLEAERTRVRTGVRAREAVEFLPAALEVLETPPSPMGRASAWTLIALFSLALGWSIIGHVDVVAVARGKVIASSHTQVVQPMEAGTVKAIHVRDGDHVVQGQVLVELDPTQAVADRDSLEAQLAAAKAEAARYAAETADNPLAAFAPPPGLPEAIVTRNRRVLQSEVDTQRAKIAGLDSDIRRAQEDLSAGRATVDKLAHTVPLLRERYEAKGSLARQGYSPRLDQLDLERQVVEAEHDLVANRHRVDQAAAALDTARQARAQAAAEYARYALASQQEAEKKVATLTQELAKAESRAGQQTLTAPIAGTVQELVIHSEGGVVRQADRLLSVVPDDARLEIEARLLNRDIGFVEEGQEAEIKLDAFDYAKYGTLPGRVIWVSRDAVPDDKLGLLYPVRVALAETSVDVGPRRVNLGPGLSAEVEIKTAKRRVIEYLLSSLQRYRHDAMRER
jgi:hemolysin D